MAYSWLKVLHIVSVVAWFAGHFYIFRLFVYHVKHRQKPGLPEAYQEMEEKLLKIIMRPAMISTILSAVGMLYLEPAWLKQSWLHFKLAFVLLLMAYHHFASMTQKRFAQGDYFLSERACRIINEVPTLLLVAIVSLVVLKPWV